MRTNLLLLIKEANRFKIPLAWTVNEELCHFVASIIPHRTIHVPLKMGIERSTSSNNEIHALFPISLLLYAINRTPRKKLTSL